ncbi:DUF1080 domain-containing protein [Pedobacter yulinensis]|uniref:DUF1080 domain-containing protein n=1 Tax=Pedobacter yulinensis TaxID=2126353 RepID=A0A2T3HPP2_9SPHI|nr:DUF1080 domain-containing protein [Pedobacter yulinensis]PST84412.1 DUF1080 domain-containing protein [Pedobacter yulinensis]
MKKSFVVAALLLATTYGAQAQKGFKSLFDGKTTTGWHTYNKSAAGSAWQIDNGALMMNPATKEGRGDLVTDKEYSNFHLKLEWKVAEGANSGIIFFVHEDPKFHATYSTGPEMQVLDDDKHPDGKINKHNSGDLYDLIKSSSRATKPVGEWNLAEIIAKNGKLELKLNGKSLVKTTMWDDNWKALIAGSKFAKWEGFGAYKSGKIALQDHGDKVWYRNIMIKEL